MKCEQFLPALETGGFVRRVLARRHAKSCTRCASTYERWQSVKASLMQPVLLSSRERGLWLQATKVQPIAASSFEYRRPVVNTSRRLAIAGGVAALLFGIGMAWWLYSLNPRRTSPEQFVDNPATPEPQTSQADEEFAALRASIDQLEQELTSLAEHAQRLDARRTAEEITIRYRAWPPRIEEMH